MLKYTIAKFRQQTLAINNTFVSLCSRTISLMYRVFNARRVVVDLKIYISFELFKEYLRELEYELVDKSGTKTGNKNWNQKLD